MGRLAIISGDDDFAVKDRSRDVACELAGGVIDDNPAADIISGDSPDLSPGAVLGAFLDSLRTPPFLTPRKLVWLRHFTDLALLCGKDVEGAAAEISAMLSKKLPDDMDVLIDGPGLDQRTAAVKAWKQAGGGIEIISSLKVSDRKFADERRLNIRDWCERHGKSIDGAAAQFLAGTLGGDSGTLANELEKLCCYVDDSPRITLEDCQAVCSRTPETVSWAFTEAIHAGRTDRALELLDVLLREGEVEMRMLAALSNEFQRLARTRMQMRELGVTRIGSGMFDSIPAGIREKFADNPLLKAHPYRAFKMCESAAGYSDSGLAAALTLVRNASRALVSSGGDRRMILEELVIKLCSRSVRG
ncbi:MAG: DNA polymerase III subunit delta [Victivallaceae bacterium]|nr:DNA polymerase III subunit delta [Victivallaceae bacterium]